MNPKLKLSLAAAGAGIALIGQGSLTSAAIAGPSFSASSNLNYGASAEFNLQQAQSFEAIGNYSGTVNPFAVTASPGAVDNTPVAGEDAPSAPLLESPRLPSAAEPLDAPALAPPLRGDLMIPSVFD